MEKENILMIFMIFIIGIICIIGTISINKSALEDEISFNDYNDIVKFVSEYPKYDSLIASYFNNENKITNKENEEIIKLKQKENKLKILKNIKGIKVN